MHGCSKEMLNRLMLVLRDYVSDLLASFLNTRSDVYNFS